MSGSRSLWVGVSVFAERKASRMASISSSISVELARLMLDPWSQNNEHSKSTWWLYKTKYDEMYKVMNLCCFYSCYYGEKLITKQYMWSMKYSDCDFETILYEMREIIYNKLYPRLDTQFFSLTSHYFVIQSVMYSFIQRIFINYRRLWNNKFL